MDFTAELAIIDKYVEIKDVSNGEPLIVELITNYFLPNNRFEESRSWRNALKDKELKAQMDTAIKAAVKDGEIVSVYTVEDFSKEICSGPHVKNTCELGRFKILKEESSSNGVRRIKAVLE